MQRVAIAVLMMAVMTACGGGGGDGGTAPTPQPANAGVATVTVTMSPAQITVGATATATAELRSGVGAVLTGRSVEWSSSAPAIASVNSAGVVSAIAAGSATITATSEGKSGSAPIAIAPAPVATVVITLALPTLTLGATTTASVVLRDERGATLTGRAITWSSTSPSVAAVSTDGAITTLAVGATTITASSEGKSASATLTVLPVPVATVSVAGAATLAPGAVSGFTATLRDASGAALSNRAITWTSSDANVAAVSASGSVSAIAPGTTTISATSEGRTGSVVLTVRYNIATVVFTGATRVKVGDSYPYTITARLSDGTIISRPVAWGIVETGRAAVTATGFVTPLQAGSFTIRVVIDGQAWTASYTAYDWDAFVGSSGTSFATLHADEAITNFVGTVDRPELVVSCGSGSFFVWVRTPHIITENGIVAYSFDNAASIGATWRELAPDYRTLWHPGTNGSTKAFASQVAASRRFGFAFGEFQVGTKTTSFRVTGLAPLLSPLLTQCPSNAIVAGAPSAGGDAGQLESNAVRVMAAYAAARGEPSARTVSREAAARDVSGPGVGDRSELLRQWPVWTGAQVEIQQAKRLR